LKPQSKLDMKQDGYMLLVFDSYEPLGRSCSAAGEGRRETDLALFLEEAHIPNWGHTVSQDEEMDTVLVVTEERSR
jgi:hypothetical protein